MPADDMLAIPRHQWLGRALDGVRQIPAMGGFAARWQRIQRKRFLGELKGPLYRRHLHKVLQHDAGQVFQAALTRWIGQEPVIQAPAAITSASGQPSRIRCSVVINTVNRSKDLAITLADLRAVWKAEQDELIIVLGPTEDDSEQVIHESPIPCQLIHCAERNLAISRNLGLHATRGRFVAFLDDDASPAAGWLDALIEPLENDPGAAVVSGFALDGTGRHFLNRYVVADTLGRSRWFDDAAAASSEIARLGAHRAFLTATGCNMGFRRDLLAGIGGFDPAFRYFLEETDVIWRLVRAGYRCTASPHSLVRHRLGANPARQPGPHLDERLVVIRSQIHFIRKFGLIAFPAAEIESCIWQRALADLEKIAWDCAAGPPPPDTVGSMQREYLLALTREFA